MKQKTSPPENKSRKLHARVMARWHSTASAPGNDSLLSDEDLRFVANCERMRVDRNGSVLAMLFVQLHDQHAESIAFFSRVLEGRLRVTDTPGRLSDGRIAILLPDTTAEGAWKVAADISEVYPAGPGRPECEVLVYPSQTRSHDFKPTEEDDSEDDFDSKPPQTYSDGSHSGGAHSDGTHLDESHSKRTEEKVAGPRAKPDANTPNEFFFTRPLPLWKRASDVLGGLTGLLASLPVLAIGAVAVKATSHGPAFFKQERAGLGGQPFTMWKLRTMHVGAEEKKQELRKFSQQDGPAFKMENDPRTTTVGRFLRWTSMDELPQFWNVLKGQMSLVGPRPLPTEEAMACEGWQRRRLHVLPGMTCTWQVSERGNVSFDEWVRMDLRYAKQHSLRKDLQLLVMTLPSLLLQRGMR